MDTNGLSQLKTVHLPPAVGIFPLAYGWYILGGLILLLALFCGYWIRRKKRKQQYQAAIFQLLLEIENNIPQATAATTLSELSIFLKRVAIQKFPEQHPQTLFGEKWLSFLDTTGKTTAFTTGAGKQLLAVYQPQYHNNLGELCTTIKEWLKVVL